MERGSDAEPTGDLAVDSVAFSDRDAARAPSPRFVWRLDADNRFAAPDPVLVAHLGERAPQEGESLDALGARIGLDRAWADAVAARATFSRISVPWPGEGEAWAAQVSGAPAFGPGEIYQGFRGFGLLGAARVEPAPAPAPAKPGPSPATPPQAGDAAALIRLLQRQHAPPSLPGANAGDAPALAVISALAALLQPKSSSDSRITADTRPARRVATAPAGAEIVVLHPQTTAPAPAAEESVALTSQERDNFKAIARALGANVRTQGPAPDAPAATPPQHADIAPPTAPEAHAPASDDFAALVDIIPIAVLVARDGETLYANKTLLDVAGYLSLEDFRARDGLKAIFRGRDPRTLAPGGVATGIPLAAGGGRILTVDAQVRPATWGGQPADLIAMRRSYEAERQEEMRAMERETEMHTARARDLAVALDAARDGMVKLDRTGRILSMNKGAQTLFDRHQVEAAGESVLTLFSPLSHPAMQAAFERLVNGESGRERLDVEGRGAEGRGFPARLDFGRLAGEPEPEYFLLLSDLSGAQTGAAQAVAGREEAENENAAKTELLSRVSHEMRTPLHAILGFAEVMIEERFGPIGNERYRDYMRDIHASGRHVLSLANDLLDLTRIKMGKMELQFAPIDVNAVVRECVTLMQPQAARERVIMRLSLFDRLPNVMADERSLRQILLNLMANAVKYNEPGGQVIVSTALDDAGAVVLRVRDTGVGMDDSELAVALEPFRRVPGAKASEGAGIGLPLTKALVEANHADFSIKSRKDQGTLVEIAFPVPRAAQ
jgi:signal transduction histidine kinase